MSTPVVPGYTDFAPIGSGGFAVVYKATQTAVSRDVAVKVLNQTHLEDDARRRFSRECRVVGSLSWHPHIAAVLDAGSDSIGRPYLIFELLEGGSLGDRLDTSGPLLWSDALDYAIQMADAVAAAHDQEVLHRDIKPDNILVDRLGRAKLADFGIAAFRDGNDTKTGVIAATLTHVAPEVLNGGRATKQSDVYLLGSTLFELISGSPPFGRAVGEDLFAAIIKISSEPPPKLKEIPALGVPQALSDAIDRALAKQPSDRWESIEAFGRALREVQVAAGQSVTPTPFIDQAGPAVAPIIDTSPDTVIAPSLPAAAAAPATPAVPLASAVPSWQKQPPESSVPERLEPTAPSAPRQRPAASQQSGAGSIAGTPALEPTGVSPAAGSSPPRKRSRSIRLVVALLLVAVGAAGFLFAADRWPERFNLDDILGRNAVALTATASGSSLGLDAELAVDGDNSTGWLAPSPSVGHQLIVGFDEPVVLDAIQIAHGPDRTSTDSAIDDSSRVGEALVELSDGTSFNLGLDVDEPVTRVSMADRASPDTLIAWVSIRITSQSSNDNPVAIREVSIEAG